MTPRFRVAGLEAGLCLALVAGGLVAGCGATGTETAVQRSYDRPVDVAFGCFGRMHKNGDPADAENAFSPMPLWTCGIRGGGPGDTASVGSPPAPDFLPDGQEAVGNDSVFWYVMAVQPTDGTMTVATSRVHGPSDGDNDAGYAAGSFSVKDGDPLIPGHNGLVVGSTPVAIATDTAGCQILTANAGTCDLSIIDLTHIALGDGEPAVNALPITAGGAPLAARPAALATVDLDSPVGEACPATPAGLAYVAFPECHAVAAVDGTGAVVASIRFAADGTATLGDGNLSCPRECGAREPITDGARPVALDIVKDRRVGFQKLAIALANRPVVTVVDLDAAGKPAAVKQVELDGDIGTTDVAISQQITMGGTSGLNDGDAGTDAEFVYAVATDGTVRVAEVLTDDVECDTQVDPRYLAAERNSDRFICLAVGDVATPPRRAGARGPGIAMPGPARPVAVAIGTSDNRLASRADPSPDLLAGHFAYVALSTGFTIVVNIDDDNYPDVPIASAPLTSQLALAMPHTVRDSGLDRGATNLNDGVRVCGATQPSTAGSDSRIHGGPRIDSDPLRVIVLDQIVEAKGYALPYVHQELCTGDDTTTPVAVGSFASSVDARLTTFPDWRAPAIEENWYFTWEGVLSQDPTDGSATIDGPTVRTGVVDIAGGGIAVRDASAPYCAAGVEPRDIITFRGCDPARGDAQCGAGETCYVHPDATVASGACLPTAQLDELSGLCRDYLVTQRRFAVVDAFADRLTLRERKRELRTTPISGCTSTAQCQTLAAYEATLTSADHPVDDTSAAPAYTYACEADPTRAVAPDRCVMTCASDDQCADGTVCRAGHCLEGIVPLPACMAGLQRYDVRGADAFVAIGQRTGYLHPIVADPGTGRCVKDPTASRLLIGRLPLVAPPCTGAADEPNPCQTTVDQTEEVPDYRAGSCTLASTTDKIVTRQAQALKFANPMMTIDVVDPTYPGDAMCRHDRGGTLVDVPTVFTGMVLRFHVGAGAGVRILGSLVGTPQVVQPANVVVAPDRSVWIVDAGDIDDNIAATPNLRGQLVRAAPTDPESTLQIQ
ncbi:MAG: hypothetical protein R3B06_21950 [Kofleriaceae bacterium]